MRIEFDVQEIGKWTEFISYASEQYNLFDEHAPWFISKGKMFGLNLLGYHKLYKGNSKRYD